MITFTSSVPRFRFATDGILDRCQVSATEIDPLDFLVECSAEFDLLVAGATKVKFLEKATVGPFSSQIAMRSSCSVAVVRVAATVKKIMPI